MASLNGRCRQWYLLHSVYKYSHMRVESESEAQARTLELPRWPRSRGLVASFPDAHVGGVWERGCIGGMGQSVSGLIPHLAGFQETVM